MTTSAVSLGHLMAQAAPVTQNSAHNALYNNSLAANASLGTAIGSIGAGQQTPTQGGQYVGYGAAFSTAPIMALPPPPSPEDVAGIQASIKILRAIVATVIDTVDSKVKPKKSELLALAWAAQISAEAEEGLDEDAIALAKVTCADSVSHAGFFRGAKLKDGADMMTLSWESGAHPDSYIVSQSSPTPLAIPLHTQNLWYTSNLGSNQPASPSAFRLTDIEAIMSRATPLWQMYYHSAKNMIDRMVKIKGAKKLDSDAEQQ